MFFARILRFSLLMGTSQIVQTLAGFARNKLIAVIVGPSGVGLMGLFSTFSLNLSTLCGCGIGVAGVRLVTSAPADERPSKYASVRQLGTMLGWLALVATLVAFVPYARITFGSDRYDSLMFIACLAAPCLVMTAVWSALLLAADEGRQVARSQMISSVAGLALGAPLIWFYGEEGIAASFLLAAIALAYATWRAAARYCPSTAHPGGARDMRLLAIVGGTFMAGELFGQLAAWFVRLIIVRAHEADTLAGLADAGYYQAAYAATGILPGFVFAAMGTNFYPLISAAKDEAAACDLTEKQVQAGLLLALPGLIGILTLSKQLVGWLYSPAFAPASGLMAWFVWAIFFNLFGWPVAYWLTARAEPGRVLAVKLCANAAVPLGAFYLMPVYGLRGAAFAYFLGSLTFAILALGLIRLRLGRWLGRSTASWMAGAGLALLLSQWVAESCDHAVIRLVPLVLAAPICGFIYLRLAMREKSVAALPSP